MIKILVPKPYFDIFSWVVGVSLEIINILSRQEVRGTKPRRNSLTSVCRGSDFLHDDRQGWHWWAWLTSSPLHFCFLTGCCWDMVIKVYKQEWIQTKSPPSFIEYFPCYSILVSWWSNSSKVISESQFFWIIHYSVPQNTCVCHRGFTWKRYSFKG